MKIKSSKTKEEFKSFDITFTFETMSEAEAFYAIFNYIPVSDYFNSRAHYDPFDGRNATAIIRDMIQANVVGLKTHQPWCDLMFALQKYDKKEK